MILEKARALGVALSESQEYLHMAAARAAMEENEAVTKMLEEYQDKQGQIVEMLSSDDMNRELVAALSSDVEILQEQLLSNPLFSQVMESQNAFQQLMNQVNREIGACIGIPEQEDRVGCSGNCTSCGGCH